MNPLRRQLRKVRWSSTAAGLAVIAVGLLTRTDFLERWELRTHDARFEWRGPRTTQARIVIAEISDRTLLSWPEPQVVWGERYAAMLGGARQAGVRWIGFDVIPAVPADDYLEGIGASPRSRPDARFADALQRAGGRVILSNLRLTEREPINPIDRFATLPETEGNVGFVDLPNDVDEVVRTVPLYVGEGQEVAPSFPALIAARARGVDPADAAALRQLAQRVSWRAGLPQFWINYTGHRFPTIAAERLADGTLTADDRKRLRGAILLIGATHHASADQHPVPGGEHQPGVMIQAEALATLLDGNALGRWPPWWEMCLTLVLGTCMAAFALRRPFGQSAAVLVVGIVVWWLLAQGLFQRGSFLLPVAGPVLAMAGPWLAYQSVHAAEETYRRLQVEAIFGRNVSRQICDYLLAAPENQARGGRLCEASILFLDIRNFVAFAARRDPVNVLEELNGFFDTVAPLIDSNGGLLYKFTGDGLMAVFGVPYPKQDHARAAVDAAVQIVCAVQKMDGERQSKRLPEWRIGCGVNTGTVVAGNVGSAERSEFTVIGDTVNVAARLQEMTKHHGGQVVLSGDTVACLESPPKGAVPATVQVRGHGPLPIFVLDLNP